MMDNQLFNLEKIKEITSPIEDLQGKISSLEVNYNTFSDNLKILSQQQLNQEFIDQLSQISLIFKNLFEKLTTISTENVNKFIIFQDNLIRKYKEVFKENLKDIQLNPEFTKKIGLYLIENRKISKILMQSSFVPSIDIYQWLDLLSSLKQNSLFLVAIKKIKDYYTNIINKRLETELSRIPSDISTILIEDYKRIYFDDPISFQEFLENIEKKFTNEELELKRNIIEKTKENENIKKLKKKQEQQQQSFNDYFKYSEREFQRRIRRKQRGNLSNLLAKPKKVKEITQDMSEKIQQFKSQLDSSFKEKYLVQRDEDTDPLELIRELKKKKQDEYNDFIKKFYNN